MSSNNEINLAIIVNVWKVRMKNFFSKIFTETTYQMVALINVTYVLYYAISIKVPGWFCLTGLGWIYVIGLLISIFIMFTMFCNNNLIKEN